MGSILKKKYYLLAALLCLSLFVFAGCGKKDNNDNAASESPATESSADPQQTDKDGDLMEDVGDGIDDAVNDAGDVINDAVDGTEDAVDDATGNGDYKNDKKDNNNSVTSGKDATASPTVK